MSETAVPSHFCVLPWVHLYLTQEGNIRPCSRHGNTGPTFGNIKDTDLLSAWTSSPAEDFRRTILSKKPSPHCFFCTQVEKSGANPYRHYENLKFGKAIDAQEWTKSKKLAGNAKPIFLELRFSNVCNLRCRTCEPWFSTAWYPEGPAVYNEKFEKPLNAFQDHGHFLKFLEENLPSVEVLRIMGGEPLIHDELYLLLEKLRALGKTDIKIYIVTNFTRLRHKNWNFIELAKPFSKLQIMASVDGAGPQAEYIRKGCTWNDIEKNFAEADGHIHIDIYPCMSVLNAFHITEAIDCWIKSGMISKKNRLCVPNFVTEQPAYYNLRIFDETERKRLRDHYTLYLVDLQNRTDAAIHRHVSGYLQYVLKFLEGGSLPEHRREFRRITRLLDEKRNESFPSLFPELMSLYRES